MNYDLHIHSCLSPCAEDDMTPNNIVNMAMLNGLDVLSVTDHNSLLQQPVIASIAKSKGLNYLYGVEIQTLEEVHLLAYFRVWEQAQLMNDYLEKYLMIVANQVNYFGHQLICDEFDQVISEYPNLLIQSSLKTIDEIIEKVHQLDGRVVLAHAINRANSLITVLGFIPESLQFDGIEVTDLNDITKIKALHPKLKETIWLMNSDAHSLGKIKMSEDETIEIADLISALWR